MRIQRKRQVDVDRLGAICNKPEALHYNPTNVTKLPQFHLDNCQHETYTLEH